MTFPLPLAPFEEYMLIDDRPAHPMSFFLRLRFDGLLDHTRLDEAFCYGVSRHPLLAANVQFLAGNRFQWVPEQRHSPQVVWRTTELNGLGAINLQRQRGVGIAGREEAGRTELLLQFHHSCCDAVGACQFVHDLLVGYHRGRKPAADDALRPEAAERLVRRAEFGVDLTKFRGMAGRLATGAARARKFLMRRAVPVKPAREGSAGEALPNDFPTSLTRRLDQPETVRLVESARRYGTTVNCLLVRDLFVSIGAFRQQYGLGHDKDWLRLVVPVNLRRPGDQQLPAANVVSMVFLDRHPTDCEDRRNLLSGVHDEMARIKQGRLGLTFLLSLRLRRSLPGAIRRLRKATAKNACQGTCVISNLVSPWKDSELCDGGGRIVIDRVVLQNVEFLPPVRALTCAAIGAVTYAGRLSLTLHYDARVLSAPEAAELLSMYFENLQISIAAGS